MKKTYLLTNLSELWAYWVIRVMSPWCRETRRSKRSSRSRCKSVINTEQVNRFTPVTTTKCDQSRKKYEQYSCRGSPHEQSTDLFLWTKVFSSWDDAVMQVNKLDVFSWKWLKSISMSHDSAPETLIHCNLSVLISNRSRYKFKFNLVNWKGLQLYIWEANCIRKLKFLNLADVNWNMRKSCERFSSQYFQFISSLSFMFVNSHAVGC